MMGWIENGPQKKWRQFVVCQQLPTKTSKVHFWFISLMYCHGGPNTGAQFGALYSSSDFGATLSSGVHMYLYTYAWSQISCKNSFFSWEEKLVVPLIAAPNGEMRK